MIVPATGAARPRNGPDRPGGRATIAFVKRALAWMAGLVGVAALGRLLAKRSAGPTTAPEATATGAEDPAAELRLRLAAQRAADPAAVEEAEALPEGETLEERRARIHAKAQQAIDAMREPSA